MCVCSAHTHLRNMLKKIYELRVTTQFDVIFFFQCCIDDSEEMMKLLIQYGGNPNATDTEKWTPLVRKKN